VDFIVGNPPFLGGKNMRRELGDAYLDALFDLWRGRVSAEADLCCYWFEKARRQIEEDRCKRVGLLATQAIRGGSNREVLERIKETGDIFFAIGDRDWIVNGASVHVSLIGFDGGLEKSRQLDLDEAVFAAYGWISDEEIRAGR
jgi:type II restriction/modification system DNA methylase subunit YeeA